MDLSRPAGVTDEHGRQVPLGGKLGEGGEGTVYLHARDPSLVVKLLHPDKVTGEFEHRIAAMVRSRPWGSVDGAGHVLLAWPSGVCRRGGRTVGFTMPRLDLDKAVPVHVISNPSDRNSPKLGGPQWPRAFNWKYLVHTAANLARAVAVVHSPHSADCVIGDFNESNVLVWHDARVSLVDCDSFQVRDPDSGGYFFTRVFKPEWLAPELADVDLRRTPREAASDLFALAFHIHQLMLEGARPFDGIWSSGEKPKSWDLAKQGLWVGSGDRRLRPRPGALPLSVLPEAVITLFRRAFEGGARRPEDRPPAEEWARALTELGLTLQHCRRDPNHHYGRHLRDCPWCALQARRLAQIPLPPARPPAPMTPPITAQPIGGRTPSSAVASAARSRTPAVPRPRSSSLPQQRRSKNMPMRRRVTALLVIAVASVGAVVERNRLVGAHSSAATGAATGTQAQGVATSRSRASIPQLVDGISLSRIRLGCDYQLGMLDGNGDWVPSSLWRPCSAPPKTPVVSYMSRITLLNVSIRQWENVKALSMHVGDSLSERSDQGVIYVSDPGLDYATTTERTGEPAEFSGGTVRNPTNTPVSSIEVQLVFNKPQGATINPYDDSIARTWSFPL